jgi:NADH:ubiquinone oxidoreductase subunit 3 (subunit A)
LLAEYAGLWVLLLLVAGLCLGMAWGSRRLAGILRNAPEQEPASNAGSESADDTDRSTLERPGWSFGPIVLLFLVFGVAAFYFVIWGVVLRDTGRSGALVMLIFSLPLASGLIYAWSKDLLE